jgi:preprotein translocase subunit SecA
MSTATLLRLSRGDLAHGRPYLERDERESPWHDRLAVSVWHGAAVPLLSVLQPARLRRARAFVARVDAQGPALTSLSDTEVRERARALRVELRRDGFTEHLVARAFALVREAGARVMDKRHFESQLIAGWWLLQGTLVEMATGEGKTFAATLPACVAALAGVPVHVITVNDYLAERDAEIMGPLYRYFGLRCGAIVQGMQRHERRAVYAGEVTYASNKELAFDYLRDRTAHGDRASPQHLAVDSLREGGARDEQVVLRGLAFAIVDEADSVFIDEARTPLILSTTLAGGEASEPYEAALATARAMVATRHHEVDRAHRRVRLTDEGHRLLDELPVGEAADGSPLFGSVRERDEAVHLALSALHLYRLDEHYVVMDGKVQIVDGSTGRVMPDRAWERGLHQMIETKEGLALTGQRETLARITYQRLFRRYLRLAGMSGTATEVAAEIGRTYGLRVMRVPLHRTSQRRMEGMRCVRTQAEKWQAVADSVERVAVGERRPVLIGTRTVRASEEISAVLKSRGLGHVVLNAKQDREEAGVVSRAGEAGSITVATNMAGRGTDIALGEGVGARGGLHVILTEYNDSARVDRQLFGRSARQGDPGSGEAIVALDDDLFFTQAPRLSRWLAAQETTRPWQVAWLRRWAQGAAEALNRHSREGALKLDRRLAHVLAFAGRGE